MNIYEILTFDGHKIYQNIVQGYDLVGAIQSNDTITQNQNQIVKAELIGNQDEQDNTIN